MNQRIIISVVVAVGLIAMVGVMLQQDTKQQTVTEEVATPEPTAATEKAPVAKASEEKVHMERSFEDAVAKAQSLNRPIMLVVSGLDCRYCDMFDNETLSQPMVAKALNRDFVSVELYPAQGQAMPPQFNTGSTPTIWFLTPDAQPMFAPLMGAVPEDEFLKALAIVHQAFTKSKS